MSKNALIVIPARYASKRLTGKPLKLIGGKPVIQRVYEQAGKMKTAGKIIVATDDKRIADCVAGFGGEAMMTSPEHKSGTDRMAEVARAMPEYELIVNIQGDEPFIDPVSVDNAVTALVSDPSINVSTLCVAIGEKEARDPNVTCVTRDLAGFALYFSKAVIPNDRDGDSPDRPLYKHLGVYVFRRRFLLEYADMDKTPLEKCEKLEQLRILEHGHRIYCMETASDSIGIDSQEDLHNAIEFVEKKG